MNNVLLQTFSDNSNSELDGRCRRRGNVDGGLMVIPPAKMLFHADVEDMLKIMH